MLASKAQERKNMTYSRQEDRQAAGDLTTLARTAILKIPKEVRDLGLGRGRWRWTTGFP